MNHPAPYNIARHRRAFTLTEILVVVGIVVLLAAIGLPMVLRAYKQGIKMRGQADLVSIATALNAYKQDFGSYPPVNQLDASNNAVLNLGPAILGKALIGTYGDGQRRTDPTDPSSAVVRDDDDPPTFGSFGTMTLQAGQCVRNSPTAEFVALVDDPGAPPGTSEKWAIFNANDGFDGPGFRTRRGPGPDGILGNFDDAYQGQSYGPYLQAEKFNVKGTMLRDGSGKPILYFPAARGKPNIRGQIQTPSGPAEGFVDRSEYSKYDANDNLGYFKRDATATEDTNARNVIRAMLGDFKVYNTPSPPATVCNGRIDDGETPATEDGFILWAAGPDGQYGPIRTNTSSPYVPTHREIDRCDDITSFTK